MCVCVCVYGGLVSHTTSHIQVGVATGVVLGSITAIVAGNPHWLTPDAVFDEGSVGARACSRSLHPPPTHTPPSPRCFCFLMLCVINDGFLVCMHVPECVGVSVYLPASLCIHARIYAQVMGSFAPYMMASLPHMLNA